MSTTAGSVTADSATPPDLLRWTVAIERRNFSLMNKLASRCRTVFKTLFVCNSNSANRKIEIQQTFRQPPLSGETLNIKLDLPILLNSSTFSPGIK